MTTPPTIWRGTVRMSSRVSKTPFYYNKATRSYCICCCFALILFLKLFNLTLIREIKLFQIFVISSPEYCLWKQGRIQETSSVLDFREETQPEEHHTISHHQRLHECTAQVHFKLNCKGRNPWTISLATHLHQGSPICSSHLQLNQTGRKPGWNPGLLNSVGMSQVLHVF